MIEALRQAAALADPVAFWLICVVLLAVALVALRKGLDGFWRLRTVADIPTAKIRSAPQGYVELSGRALDYRGPLSAPLTRAPCVWYRYKVEERKRSGKSEHWVTVEKGEADSPFLLDDGTGRCLVEPTGAELHCRTKRTWYGASRHPSGPPELGWLGSHRRYRYKEERILASEPVYLLGRFETPRRGAREQERLVRHLLSTWKRDPERMDGFDKNGDGEISLAEWEQARVKAREVAERSESRLRAEPPLSRATRTQDPRRPFVISTLSEDSLLLHLRLWAFGGTFLFLLLGSGVGFAVIARLTHA